jgi:diguanylate cyclase (GGDEF)-like protein
MCDVDKFKEVNDTYGHPAGDAVLRQVAQLLRSEAREVDRVGRYGGEEFMLVLPGANGAAATAAAERVRKAVEGHTFSFAGAVIRRTMSCGVASWPHPGIADVAALVCAADEALYAAKAQGRNRVTRWAVRGIGAGESVVDTLGTKTPTAHTLYDPPTHDGEQRPGTGTGISHDARRSAT